MLLKVLRCQSPRRAAGLQRKSESPHFLPLCRLPLYQKAWRKAKVDSQQPARTKLISLVLCYTDSVESQNHKGCNFFAALVHMHPPTHPLLIGSIRFSEEEKTWWHTNDVLEGLSERRDVRWDACFTMRSWVEWKKVVLSSSFFFSGMKCWAENWPKKSFRDQPSPTP